MSHFCIALVNIYDLTLHTTKVESRMLVTPMTKEGNTPYHNSTLQLYMANA